MGTSSLPEFEAAATTAVKPKTEPAARTGLRLTFVAGNLACGGAQRSMLVTAEELARRGHQITVVTLESSATDFFEVPAAVTRHSTDLGLRLSLSPGELFKVRGRLRRLRRELRATRPDVVISVEHRIGVVVLMATWGTRLPVFVWEHGALRTFRFKLVLGLLRRLLYRRAEAVVSVSDGLDESLSWLPSDRRHVIRNPIMRLPDDPVPQDLLEAVDDSKRWVVSMGRLYPVKGYDLLLRSWALVAPSLPDCQLIVIGEGSDRPALDALRDELDLGSSVALVGQVSKPFGLLKRAAVYVMSSRAEGYPMTLLEAMASGLPVVSFDCPTGPREVLSDGDNGLLVPAEDVEALAEALRRVLLDEELRSQLAAGAATTVQSYDGGRIVEQWQSLFEAAVGEGARSSI